ncbi:helix-turn-helix domain-containing protein [Photobacterium alginatilyticum]|uniref:Helix-turn-helix domain-containing protein n=1 Tax=Photobacterium alginatilyticum TaxID=1775171 RepID=A0ABW9YJ40_9GAMM|nr:helix-turn-helix domain-containing protein [Photobacterium alginatilyticum]NBI53817.1 helix-turn-helix domain-containing protein [Photobacterium alginatilyticum]
MQTQLIRPSLPLGRYITQYWMWEQNTPLMIPDILPGTGVEIMLNLGAPLVIDSPKSAQLKFGDGLVICPRKSAYKMTSMGATKLLSIRFRSAAFFPLFGIPLTTIADQVVEISQLMPKGLLLRIIESDSTLAAIALLEGWLMQLVRPVSASTSELGWAVDKIYYQNSPDVIADIKRSLNISERTFQRKFKAYTGVDAKYFERTSRFQSTLRTLLSGCHQQYTAIVLDHGYYDQPHFIKDCKHFTGLTPKQFLTESNFALNHYNNDIYA